MSSTETDRVILELKGVRKTFGTGPRAVHAIADLDLAVSRGEILLIMGPSGSGKTTLLTVIGGLLRPTAGTVRIDGYEVTSAKESDLYHVRRHLVGFVFQTFNLLDSLTVLENVEVALDLPARGGRDARDKARTLLIRLGLEGRLDFRPHDVSGGEKQRVSIARALANDHLVVLADEPTANLDSKNGREVTELLVGIAKDEDRSVIIVSHDERIVDVADRVLSMEDGRLLPPE
jgi:putative ABC transport system ATP-binding protein